MKKHNLGICVYPDKSPKEEVYRYIEKASQLGYSRITTCFLSVSNEKRDEYLIEFKEFTNKAHELGFLVAADTNPAIFDLLGASFDNLKPFADLGLDIIRMDTNFGIRKDIQLTRNPYNILIEFNASNNSGVESLIEQGGNKDQIIMCHNFYPERYTGLDFELFKQLNCYWKSLNLHTCACISSNNKNTIGPWKVFCGLPTVEIMRGLPIDLQARYLLATGHINDLLIGNYPATDEELESLSKINYQAIEIKIDETEGCSDIEKYIMYDYSPHYDRFDHSSFMIRSSMPRLLLKEKKQMIPHRHCDKKVFTKGDILIVNDHLKHYCGELQIVLKDIVNDGERNYVGRVKEEEIALLDYIKPGHHFKIIESI